MAHACDPDEGLEVLGDEGGSVVGDDPGPGFGVLLPGSFEHDLDVGFLHRLPDLRMHQKPAATIEHRGQVVEGAIDIDVRDIHVPVVVGCERLLESRALGLCLLGPTIQATSLRQDPVDTGRTDRHDVVIDHHEAQSAVALQRVAIVVVEDGLLLVFFEPEIARDLAIVLVELAVALPPFVELPSRQAEPAHQSPDGEPRPGGPMRDEVHDLVAQVRCNPGSVQSSPMSFFACTNASETSAITSFFFCTLASSSRILDPSFAS